MLSREDCRARAKECVELAQTLREPQRTTLIVIAQTWLTLADDPFHMEVVATDEQSS